MQTESPTRIAAAATETGLNTSACPSMRWRLGRQFWRHDRDEGFRRTDFVVDQIADGPARRFVNEHHYAASYPFARERYGLFRGDALVGVAVFSTPINNAVVPRYAAVPAEQGLDLGRFVLLDEVPYNAESFFLASAMRMLSKARPDLRAIVAYSDPYPRKADNGTVVMPGHVGISYQATNAHYVGRSAPKTLHLTSSGHALSTRALSKIRLGEHGAQSAERRLVWLGAPSRNFGEEPRMWIARVLSSGTFRRVAHPGNHVYVWPLQRKLVKHVPRAPAPQQPYPKSLDA